MFGGAAIRGARVDLMYAINEIAAAIDRIEVELGQKGGDPGNLCGGSPGQCQPRPARRKCGVLAVAGKKTRDREEND